jgi:hypothetical protein
VYLTTALPRCMYLYKYSNMMQLSHSQFARLIPPSTRIVHRRNRKSSPLHPHLLQMSDDSHVGVHVTVDAVLHAGVLVTLERAGGHATSDALLEADGVELVDGCYDKSV